MHLEKDHLEVLGRVLEAADGDHCTVTNPLPKPGTDGMSAEYYLVQQLVVPRLQTDVQIRVVTGLGHPLGSVPDESVSRRRERDGRVGKKGDLRLV